MCFIPRVIYITRFLVDALYRIYCVSYRFERWTSQSLNETSQDFIHAAFTSVITLIVCIYVGTQHARWVSARVSIHTAFTWFQHWSSAFTWVHSMHVGFQPGFPSTQHFRDLTYGVIALRPCVIKLRHSIDVAQFWCVWSLLYHSVLFQMFHLSNVCTVRHWCGSILMRIISSIPFGTVSDVSSF